MARAAPPSSAREWRGSFLESGKEMFLILRLIGWAIVGLIAGTLARKAVPGVRSGGVLVDCLTGMVGSIIGGFLSLFFPFLQIFWGIPAAFVGAVILLFILKSQSRTTVR
jgi:uncharacterized membrane protein YeaQ/YmgE (transglycosylase-associated protein family)